MKGILKHTALLAIITILAGLALGLVHEITLEPIAQAKEQQKQNAYKSVFADADAFEAKDFDQAEADKITSKFGKCSINEVVEAKKGNETIGYIITVTDGEGYAGNIQFTVGIDADSKVTGVSFLSIAESPGLGMNARDDASFTEQYTKPAEPVEQFEVVKAEPASDDQIQALSGATITSKAVTGGINAALAYFSQVLKGGAA